MAVIAFAVAVLAILRIMKLDDRITALEATQQK